MPIQRYYGKQNGKMVTTDDLRGWCKGPEVAKLEAQLAKLIERESNSANVFGGPISKDAP